jgi:hypothetical protein
MWVAPVRVNRRPTRLIRVSALNEGAATMSVEYLVLQADAEQGAFARVSAQKLNRSWETLQEALDELGQQEWDLCTTIYSPTKERNGPGEHYCEGFILKRPAYAGGERTSAPESVREARAF